jgi:hypothetical protein
MPIDDDCPFTAICSTRHRHGSLKTGDNSEQVTHSDECAVVKIKAKIASERRNFILEKTKLTEIKKLMKLCEK